MHFRTTQRIKVRGNARLPCCELCCLCIAGINGHRLADQRVRVPECLGRVGCTTVDDGLLSLASGAITLLIKGRSQIEG